MAGSWGCPHEANGLCAKVKNLPCNPGMKGCTLSGRFVFFDDDKNERLRQKLAQRTVNTMASNTDTPDDVKA